MKHLGGPVLYCLFFQHTPPLQLRRRKVPEPISKNRGLGIRKVENHWPNSNHQTNTQQQHRVVKASASEAVDSGLIPSRVKPITGMLVFAASLLDAQH